jgi:hypothetical protein
VREAEVIKGTYLPKSVLINESVVGKGSRTAVGIIRGTKLSIDGARIAAADAVAATKPGPSNGITNRDICCGRREGETIYPDRNVEDLARTRWYSAHDRPSVLIHNMDDVGGGLLLLRRGDVSVTRSSFQQKYRRKHRCQRKSQPYYCV